MAVDLKNLVDRINNLTYQELCQLIKALYSKFFSDRDSTSTDYVMPKTIPASAGEKEDVKDVEDKPQPAAEEEEEEIKSEYDPHIPAPEELGEDGELEFDYDFEDDEFDEDDELEDDLHVVYAWQWSGDDRFAKIGVTTESRLDDRINKGKTYHPKDEPIRIGVCIEKYKTRKQARAAEKSILEKNELKLTHPRREWVKIDGKFKKMIDKYFE